MAKRIQQGSLLDHHILPTKEMQVWVLTQTSVRNRLKDVPVRGKVTMVFAEGWQYCYVDIALEDGRNVHYPLNRLFDHKPKYTPVTDQYGETKVWR